MISLSCCESLRYLGLPELDRALQVAGDDGARLGVQRLLDELADEALVALALGLARRLGVVEDRVQEALALLLHDGLPGSGGGL